MKKTLGELLREPEQHGWKVMNLFQIPQGWRCNLHGPQARSFGFTEFADAATPEEAVAAALESMHIAMKRGFLSAEQKRAMLVWENSVRRLSKMLGCAKELF